jgi:hypothetical protein
MSHTPELPPGGPGPYGGYGPVGQPGYTPPGYGPPGFGGPGWTPPKKTARPEIVIVVGAAIAIAAFLTLAIWQFFDNARTRVVFTDDKDIQIEVPARWSPNPELKKNIDRVVLRLADPTRHEYLIVATAPKKHYPDGLTAQAYANLYFKQSEKEGKLDDVTVSEPVKLEIGGRPAIQYDISRSVDGKASGELLTVVDGPKAFHEIEIWTFKSEFDAKRAVFARAASTFKED